MLRKWHIKIDTHKDLNKVLNFQNDPQFAVHETHWRHTPVDASERGAYK